MNDNSLIKNIASLFILAIIAPFCWNSYAQSGVTSTAMSEGESFSVSIPEVSTGECVYELVAGVTYSDGLAYTATEGKSILDQLTMDGINADIFGNKDSGMSALKESGQSSCLFNRIKSIFTNVSSYMTNYDNSPEWQMLRDNPINGIENYASMNLNITEAEKGNYSWDLLLSYHLRSNLCYNGSLSSNTRKTDYCNFIVMPGLNTSGNSNRANYNGNYDQWDSLDGMENHYSTVTYFDSQCRQLPINQVHGGSSPLPVCKSFRFLGASPISLVWQESDLLPIPTVTAFPLRSIPENNSKFYLWFGSSAWPLLVFDPSHKGIITSAEQLFGQNTFGKVWKNGFEALGSLDLNHDGVVAGEELNDLGLWFDKNQNGISETGEVVSVHSKKITSLAYNDPEVDPSSGFISQSNAYQAADGKHGRMIDWISAGAASRQETEKLISGYIEKNKQKATEMLRSAGAENAQMSRKSLTGVWLWAIDKKFTDKDSIATSGVLSFFEKKDGSLTGNSMVELVLKDNQEGASRAIESYPIIKGGRQISADNKTSYKFLVQTAEANIAENTVRLLNNGTELEGATTQQIKSKDGKLSTFYYTWKAKKIISKKAS